MPADQWKRRPSRAPAIRRSISESFPRERCSISAGRLWPKIPSADTLWLPCPHWAVAEAIDLLEKEFGINAVTAHQAITWHALRRCKIDDSIAGFGLLMREFRSMSQRLGRVAGR